MAKKITELTEAQKARFGEWRDKWIAIGLSTQRADRERFEEGARKCYQFAGLEPPKRIIWVESPLAVVKRGPTEALLLENPKADKETIKKTIKDDWSKYIGGQFWVGGWWGAPAFVSFFREVCGLVLDGDMDERALAYQATAESAGWWWPHTDFIVVSERPTKITRDDQGRLHSETGNAIEWADGFGVASWHGTTVPKEWLENRATLDPSIALTDSSVERRRAAVEITGWAKILKALPHKVLDKDEDPEIGTLMSVDLPDAPDSRFVLVKCATGRDFALPVPREMKTALEAQAWTYDIKPWEHDLEIRT